MTCASKGKTNLKTSISFLINQEFIRQVMSFFSPSPAEDDVGEIIAYSTLLQATTGTRNPNLQVVIMHALHVSIQHSFELSHHARLDLLSLLIRSRVF